MEHDHIGVLIKKASLEFERKANTILSKENITPSQFKVLKYVALNPRGSVRQIDLEAFFGMTNPTVTGILQNLEKKELITRESHPLDKRSKVILLTDQSQTLKKDILETSERIEDCFTETLSADEKELLKTLLLKLLDHNHLSL